MDLFTFGKTTNAFNLESSPMINGYDGITWTERFRDASEFIITGPLDGTLEQQLPVGNLISHTETEEVMVVENHEIQIDDDVQKIVISGRGFETFLENRIVAANRNWPVIAFPYSKYTLTSNVNALTARMMITNHIDWQELVLDSDSLGYVNTWLSPFISNIFKPMFAPENEAEYDVDTVYKYVLELLAVDNIGFNAVRPTGKNYDDGYDVPTRYGADFVTIRIYPGFERSSQVVFSEHNGDISGATYLRSNKSLKTSCIVKSKYFLVRVDGPETNYSRRIMLLDATDLDDQYDSVPGSTTGNRIRAIMTSRGRAAIQKQRAVSLSNIKITQGTQTNKYRRDYNLGDLVTVNGLYNSSAVQQVMEHVEIEDENGFTSYPTLSDPYAGGYYVPSNYV